MGLRSYLCGHHPRDTCEEFEHEWTDWSLRGGLEGLRIGSATNGTSYGLDAVVERECRYCGERETEHVEVGRLKVSLGELDWPGWGGETVALDTSFYEKERNEMRLP